MKFTFNQPVIYGLASVVLLASCKTEEKKEVATVEKIPGINLQYMDTTASPNNNFFRFVNGKWLDETEIPADKTTWGSFNELRENTDDDALSILNAAKDNPNINTKIPAKRIGVNVFFLIISVYQIPQRCIK